MQNHIKLSRLLSMALMLTLLAFSAAGAQPLLDSAASDSIKSENTDKTPLAVVMEPDFKFPPTPDGVLIVHDFVIQNHGDADLTINSVNTG